jgi:uncharacterized repeat protein (TIGR04076 family)
MKRRGFLGKTGCGLTGAFLATPLTMAQQEKKDLPPPKPARYKIEVEIFEALPNSWCHKKGDKFAYPEDMSKICPWLRSSMHDFIVLLEHGVTLPWKYEKTPYEKVIDPNGVTTEFIRCPDPTSNLVAKIIRTRLS